MRTMPAGEFKAKCLAVMDEVNTTGLPVLVTKRGKPMVRILPSRENVEDESPDAIFGCLRDMGCLDGDIGSSPYTDEEWERMFQEKWDRFQAVTEK